jgi:hypothetical protein
MRDVLAGFPLHDQPQSPPPRHPSVILSAAKDRNCNPTQSLTGATLFGSLSTGAAFFTVAAFVATAAVFPLAAPGVFGALPPPAFFAVVVFSTVKYFRSYPNASANSENRQQIVQILKRPVRFPRLQNLLHG